MYVSNPNMKTVYDDPNFVRRIHKYKRCRLNITLFKRALLSHWSVAEKVTVKKEEDWDIKHSKEEEEERRKY